MEPRVRKMSKKSIERDFTNEVIDFPDLPRAPSAEQMGCGGISDFVFLLSRSCTQEPEKMISEPELSK